MNIEIIKSLNKLKNASLSNKESICLKYNKFTLNLLKFLYEEGFVLSFIVFNDKKSIYSLRKIKVCLRFFYNKPVLKELKVLSSSSKASFLSHKNIVRLNSKKALYCFSTSQGVLSALTCKKRKLGGVLLFVC